MGPFLYTTFSLVQFQHSCVMTFLYLELMCGSPTPHIFILSSVSRFKCYDFFLLKTFMCESPPPHHFILGSVLTFKHDDFPALEHLCVPSGTPKKCQKIHQNRLRHLTSTNLRVTSKKFMYDYLMLGFSENTPTKQNTQKQNTLVENRTFNFVK